MFRTFLLGIFIFSVAYLLRLYVDGFNPAIGREEMVNTLEGITIRSYSKEGLEWTIKGKSMQVVGKDIRLFDVELTSEEATVRAREVMIDRSTGTGSLSGDVLLLSGNMRVKSQKVYMNLKEGQFSSDEKVEIRDEGNSIEAAGFQLSLKPLRIIISKAKVRME